MSNCLTVQLCEIRDTTKDGTPVGYPYYGILAYDGYSGLRLKTFDTPEDRRLAIEESDCTLTAVFDGNKNLAREAFGDYRPDVIGKDNYYGGEWYA
jgi:hypothetical protein